MTRNEKLDLLLNGEQRAVMLFGEPGGGMVTSAVKRQPTAQIFTLDRSTFLGEVFAFLKQNADKTVILHVGYELDLLRTRSSTHAYNACHTLAYLLAGAADGKIMFAEGGRKQEVVFTGSLIILSFSAMENVPKVLTSRTHVVDMKPFHFA